jgi:hypothetical protein
MGLRLIPQQEQAGQTQLSAQSPPLEEAEAVRMRARTGLMAVQAEAQKELELQELELRVKGLPVVLESVATLVAEGVAEQAKSELILKLVQ